jgi:uncharacterized protein YjbI with pentapeptide repeats
MRDVEREVVRALKAGEGDYREQDIERIQFQDCDLSGQSFFQASLENVVFTRCNLSLVDFRHARLQAVRFVECKLVGIPFLNADPFALEIHFQSCKLISCNFGGMRLRKAAFRDCDLQDCAFIGSDMAEADFSRSMFRGSEFNGTDLRKADFRGAAGYRINPLNNKVRKARFDLPEVLSLLEFLDIEITP